MKESTMARGPINASYVASATLNLKLSVKSVVLIHFDCNIHGILQVYTKGVNMYAYAANQTPQSSH